MSSAPRRACASRRIARFTRARSRSSPRSRSLGSESSPAAGCWRARSAVEAGSSCRVERSRSSKGGSARSSTTRKTFGRCPRVRNVASPSRATRRSWLETRWRRSVSNEKKSSHSLLTAEVVMTSYRADQVGEQVREEIMSIIRRELKDPRIGFVSITAVRMSPALRSARVRVSVLGNPEQKKESLAGLVSARGLIRHELGRRLQNLKFSPDLRFELDPSIEYSVHISELLKEVLPEANGDAGEKGS